MHWCKIVSPGRFIISYNGELYNYLEIKKNLEQKGYKFETNGDTEVFLKGFIEFGKNFFKLINGIFAVSIFDKKNDLLIGRPNKKNSRSVFLHGYMLKENIQYSSIK